MKIVEPSFEVLHPSPFGRLEGLEMLRRIEAAGRTCYKSEYRITEDSAARFVAMICKRGHESVLEHESIQVRVVCDRGVSHELVRHRIGVAFSQESTRYCNYGKAGEVTFVRPPWLDDETLPAARCARDAWDGALRIAEGRYLKLLRFGWSPQQARSVLPNSLKTELVVTANLREWRHIFKLRCSTAAHPQMRELMLPLQERFQAVLPEVFGDWRVNRD